MTYFRNSFNTSTSTQDSDITDSEDIQVLQFSQLTLPFVCVELLTTALPISMQHSEDYHFLSRLTHLLLDTCDLLIDSVVGSLLWNDSSAPVQHLVSITFSN